MLAVVQQDIRPSLAPNELAVLLSFWLERSASPLCHIDFETSIFFFFVLFVFFFRNSDKKSGSGSVKSDKRRWESLPTE